MIVKKLCTMLEQKLSRLCCNGTVRYLNACYDFRPIDHDFAFLRLGRRWGLSDRLKKFCSMIAWCFTYVNCRCIIRLLSLIQPAIIYTNQLFSPAITLKSPDRSYQYDTVLTLRDRYQLNTIYTLQYKFLA